MKKKQSEGDRNIWRFIAVEVLIGVALSAAIVAGVKFVRQRQAQDRLDELAAGTWTGISVVQFASEDPVQETETPVEIDPIQALIERGVPIPEKEVNIDALRQEVNEDIYAWIYIPDNKIDYPVLRHATDNSHYLNYNLDGSKGYPGCIYTENYNSMDFLDPNTVLYGHNMNNGTMFAGLHEFEDSEYFDTHPYVYIYTEEGLLVYEVIAAYESDDRHILYNNDFSSDDVYEDYLQGIFETGSGNGYIREGVEVTKEDRIITLSTCVDKKPNNRYLVQGVLLNKDSLKGS